MRCFVAIELNESTRNNIAAFAGDLKPLGAEVKWVSPENLHLTLKFLGEVPETSLPSIKNALASAIASHKQFALAIVGTGTFPPGKRPSILWIGIKDESQLLSALASSIEKALEPLGFEPDGRPFKAHLTIGRAKGSRGMLAVKAALDDRKDLEFGMFNASAAHLIKSTLTPSGPIYEKFEAFPLS